jgi:LCP family protein required for cell wall assembly
MKMHGFTPAGEDKSQRFWARPNVSGILERTTMDNFRKHKKSRVKPAPVDGFVTDAAQPGKGSSRARPSLTFDSKAHRHQLGNFKRADGLHPTQQGRLSFDGTMMAGASGRNPKRDAKGEIVVDPNAALQGLDKPSGKLKKKPKRRVGKIIKRSALVLAAVMIIGGGFLSVKAYLKSRKILAGGGGAAALEENVDPTKLNGEGDGRINILMLGKGGVGHEAPDLTDTILIASIDPVQKEAALVSIPRDTYVKTPSSGSMKINAVYATAKNKILNGKKIDDQANKAEEAGLKAIEDEVEEILGIPMHYHAMVDFTGFKQAIDAVGGIDINVTEENTVYEVMRIDGKNYTLNVKAGQQHFDGFRALAYSRSRHTSTRGDFSRAERQRLVLMALKTKALSLGTLSNPLKINELLDAFGDHVKTNFTQRELLRIYDIGKGIDSAKVQSIGLADPPNNFLTTSNIGGQSVVVPRAGLNDYKAIQSFIRNTLRDGFLREEDASFAVYNGTSTTGLAAKTAEDLKSYGYNITTVADAPTKNYAKTVIVDMRNGAKKYTKHYLEQRLDTTAVTSLPDGINAGTADFVIILGTNEVQRLAE